MRFTTHTLIKFLVKHGRYTDDELSGKSNEELLEMVNRLADLAETNAAL